MPDYNLVPEKLATADVMQINIEAKKLTTLSGYPRNEEAPIGGATIKSWRFLAPNEIAENIVHTWEEYESMGTRLAQQAVNLHKASKTTKQAKNTLKSGMNNMQQKIDEGGAHQDSYGGLAGDAIRLVDIPVTETMNTRVDSTLIYRNSNRREYTLSFELGHYDNNTKDKIIFEAIRALQELSCPEMNEESPILIEFPAVFKLFTSPHPLLYVEGAALTSVQPTWKQPYRKGFPMHVDLSLTFQEIAPMYRKNFSGNGASGIVQVG